MEKSLDRKIARILADPSCRDFILADAKDADMAFGLAAPGRSPEHHAGEARFRTLGRVPPTDARDRRPRAGGHHADERQHERDADDQGAAVRPEPGHAGGPRQRHDRHLAGRRQRTLRAAAVAALPHGDDRPHPVRQGGVRSRPSAAWGPTWGSIPSRSTTTSSWTDRTPGSLPGVPHRGRGQGLPPFPGGLRSERPRKQPPADLARFINDNIVRALAGVTSRGRPLFLKIVYHGPAAMEALARYDRSLVIGILGGSAGTTFDAFHMLWEAKKYGAAGRPLRPEDQQGRAPIELRRAPPRRGRRPVGARRGGQGVSRRAAEAGQSARTARWPTTCSAPRRRSSYSGERRRKRLRRRNAAECVGRDARLREDESGGKGAVEPRPLEADHRLIAIGSIRSPLRRPNSAGRNPLCPASAITLGRPNRGCRGRSREVPRSTRLPDACPAGRAAR